MTVRMVHWKGSLLHTELSVMLPRRDSPILVARKMRGQLVLLVGDQDGAAEAIEDGGLEVVDEAAASSGLTGRRSIELSGSSSAARPVSGPTLSDTGASQAQTDSSRALPPEVADVERPSDIAD